MEDHKEATRDFYVGATHVVSVLSRQYFMVVWDASLIFTPRPSMLVFCLLAMCNASVRYQLQVTCLKTPMEAVLHIHTTVIYPA